MSSSEDQGARVMGSSCNNATPREELMLMTKRALIVFLASLLLPAMTVSADETYSELFEQECLQGFGITILREPEA